MKKPIYRVYCEYQYRNKGIRTKLKKGFLDTFIFSLKKDEVEIQLREKIFSKLRLGEDNIILILTDIKIGNQHGYTTDRF
jgi:hypothetical protein